MTDTTFKSDRGTASQGPSDSAQKTGQAMKGNGSLSELMDNITTFARRQPGAFLGLSVLAGFAAVRFLKATGSSGRRTSTDYSSGIQAPGNASRETKTGYFTGMQATSGASEW